MVSAQVFLILERPSNPVPQRRPIADCSEQFITRVDRADARGRSGEDEVAREQGERLAGEGDNLRYPVNHLAGSRPLFHLAVLSERNLEISRIHLRVNEWPDRCVSVERFAARELL